MSTILAGAALREEFYAIKAASASGPRQDLDKLWAEFLQWVSSHCTDEKWHLLKREHLLDEPGLIGRLAKKSSDQNWESLFNQFSEEARDKLRPRCITTRVLKFLSRKSNHLLGRRYFECPEVDLIVQELNVLLGRQGEIFAEERRQKLLCSPQGPILCRAIEARLLTGPPAPSQVARNRFWLQLAFPDIIGKVWDTLPLVQAWIDSQEPLHALCLSGGGIRSATFGLGVLQELAHERLLPKIDYLSTVSGGGYIGGWLSAWSKQSDGFAKVQKALTEPPSDPEKPEPPQVSHLRDYSNYLAPKLGITSADTWTLLATYLRNLALNWMVFLPALVAVLALPRISLAMFKLVVSSATGYGALVGGVLFAIFSIVYVAWNRPSLRDSRNSVRGQGMFLVFCLTPMLLSSLCFTSVWAWLQNGNNHFTGWLAGWHPPSRPSPALFLALGTVLHVLAWGCYVRRLKTGRLAEFAFCVLSGMAAGLLLWRGALLWYVNFNSVPEMEVFVCFATPYFVLSFLLAVFLFVGIASRWTDDDDREWLARLAAWFLLAAGVWALFSTLVLFGPEWLRKLPRLLTALGGTSGVLTLVLTHSGLSAANKKEAAEARKTPIPINAVLWIAAPIFVAVFMAALSLGTTWLITKVGWGGKHVPSDGATLLSEQDLTDLPFLAARLKSHTESDPRSAYLWSQFRLPLQSQINEFDLSEPKTKALRTSLTIKLNELLEQERLATNAAFWSTNFPMEIKKALAQGVAGQRKIQSNRYLLEQAYSRELKPARFDPLMITHQTPFKKVVILALSLALASLAASLFVDINRFSLHAVYRNRLIRAYLGASNPNRHPNAFTGFDPDDNLRMSELNHRPFHVVNMALNLVGGDNLAWQQRKAESFTASALHVGSFRLGFRKVEEYASKTFFGWGTGRKDQSLMLGTAMTISGAAASPNMGYHSSPVLAVLMTLFNVRLGAWFGNPGKAGEKWYKDQAPRSAFWHVVAEAFGLTNEKSRYVYLSDGGHFENLGLYEMVLRRCRFILVCDAGADPDYKFEDLANAIRKCRVDFGIRIDLDVDQLRPEKGRKSSRWHCAVGRIRYDDADPAASVGTLFYIKPSLTGDEPPDVQNYAVQNPTFPHESTADQFFDESQFESYRALGSHVARETLENAVRNSKGGDLKEVFSRLRRRWFPPPPGLESSFLESTKGFVDLQETLLEDGNLRHLSFNLYPELQPGGGSVDKTQIEMRRAELHTVSIMLQVMENAWLGVRLDEFHAHPLNRGWMNVFRRWTNSSILRNYWPMLRGEYSQDFVSFCETELNLDAPEPSVVQIVTRVQLRAVNSRTSQSGPKELLRNLKAEYDAEWPGQVKAGRALGKLIGASAQLAESFGSPPVWIITTEAPKMNGVPLSCPCGIVLLYRTEACASGKAEFLVWLSGPYRNLGIAPRALASEKEKLWERIETWAEKSKSTLLVRYPSEGRSVRGSRLGEAMWTAFFSNLGFHRQDRDLKDLVLVRVPGSSRRT